MNISEKLPYALSVVMPVFNEEGVIAKVVDDFAKVLERFERPQLVAVNDCSTDRSLAILEGLKARYPFLVVRSNEKNSGHGPTLLAAYRAATGEYIFHADSDDQFVAEDFWPLWEKLRTEGLDLVIGYRGTRHDPFARLILTRFLKVFLFLAFGQWLRDSNSPFRLMTRRTLDEALAVIPERARIPSIFMVVATNARGLKVGWVNVRHLARLTGKSFLRSFKIFTITLSAVQETLEFKRRLSRALRTKAA